MASSLIVNLIISSAGFAFGGVYLKRYADLGIAFGIFALSNLVYANVLAKGLGQGAALSSMAHLLIMSALGVLVFGERLGIYNVTGLIFALLSIWFLALETQSA